jgi:AraC family transcriptional regulator
MKYPELPEPQDYYRGIGRDTLPTPTDVLLFQRSTKEKLQIEALQNRSHHRFVLIYNIETTGHIQVDNHVFPFKPGQAMLIQPYQFHHFIQMGSSRLYWLFCTFELSAGTFLEPLRNQVVDPGEISVRAFDDLFEEWGRCTEKFTAPKETQAGRLQSTLIHLLLSLKQDLESASIAPPVESDNNLLQTINRLMSEWRGRTVIVSDLAQELDISESRLRTQFKEAAGIAMGSYLRNYRLNRAMALLRNSKDSIAEIAEEAGFGSPQAFCRTFKKEISLSPRHYRLQR